MSLVQTSAGNGLDITIDREAILRSLKLDPRSPDTQALILVCERYGLDPLLKHMVLIQNTPYVTRDGYLAIAHRSGKFDGMEVVNTGADQTHYWAKVAVYRKDMGRPFTYVGRFPKSKSMAKEYGPEMAIKVAEVAALRRAFNITGVGAADERWDDEADDARQAPAPALEAPAAPSRARKDTPDRFHKVGAAKGLSEEQRRALIASVSGGRTTSAGELSPDELTALFALLDGPAGDPVFNLAQRVADISGRGKELGEEAITEYLAFAKEQGIPSAKALDRWTPELCDLAESMLLTLEESAS